LKQIETELGWENHRNMSYAALRPVLHALRDRLTVQEAADLAAQLPLLVKNFLRWLPSGVPKKIPKDELLEEIRKNFTFSLDRSINDVIIVVAKVLRKHVSILDCHVCNSHNTELILISTDKSFKIEKSNLLTSGKLN
jgi:uncharacterized protein (DUF2267 family)